MKLYYIYLFIRKEISTLSFHTHLVVWFSSVAQSCPTLGYPTDCSMPDFPVHHQLPELTQTHMYWVGDGMQHPHLLSSVVPFSSRLQCFQASGSFPINQIFSSGGQSIEVSASASGLPVNIQGLISFRMDWLDLLAVQGTLKSLLQHHSSKASVLWYSAFIVQLSHPYTTTGKTIALTRRTFLAK